MPITYLPAFLQGVHSTAKNRRSICRDDEKRIFIAYTDYTGAFRRVHLTRSIDNGLNWTDEEIPGQGAAHNQGISIAVDSQNRLIAVWTAGTELWYCKRSEAGAWGAIIIVASVGGSTCDHGSVAIDATDTAHIVWRENTGVVDDIRYNTITVAGVLGAQINVTNLGVRRQVEPHIAVCTNNIAHIVWKGTGWGAFVTKYNIQYNRVTAGILGLQVGLTNKNINHDDPELATDSTGAVHIVWREWVGLGTEGLYYVNNVGGAFGVPLRILTVTSYAGLSITLDAEDKVYAFYCRPIIPGTLTILSNDGGGWVTDYTITMDVQQNDIYAMHSWYPRSGGASPNILSNNWLAYTFWPLPGNFAYLIFPAPLPPIGPVPPPPPPPPPPPINVLTLPATEIR